jgi:hypothetical protein
MLFGSLHGCGDDPPRRDGGFAHRCGAVTPAEALQGVRARVSICEQTIIAEERFCMLGASGLRVVGFLDCPGDGQVTGDC